MKILRPPHLSSRIALHTVAMTTTTTSSKQSSGFHSLPRVLLALALSGVVVSASGGVASASSKTASKKSSTASIKKFDSCLKKHGVSTSGFGLGAPPKGGPSGSTPSGGFSGGPNFSSNPKMKAALQACSSLLPKGSQFGGGAGASSTAFAAYRNCMTLHHVTLPKGSSPGAPSTNSAVTSNPNFKKANAACSALLPTPAKTPPKN